jgi:uncharacterized protein
MILSAPSFRPPRWQPNGQAQTIVPGAFRKVAGVAYTRERIGTPDDDFLDLDWVQGGHDRLVIVTHGLEGSSHSQYALGTARLLPTHGWDVLAWNCRSCSGEMNRQFRLYYHGDTADIETVVHHAIGRRYRSVVLAGFSMGGNITMKYVGTRGDRLPAEVRAAIAFCAPTDLESGAEVLDLPQNYLYKKRFMDKLAVKIQVKAERFPGRLQPERLRAVRRWRDFDEWFSAPMCGYADAAEFYADSSARFFVGGTRVPTLLVNPINDPILTPACSPQDLAREHPFFHLQMPAIGGHCGFMERGQASSWAERRIVEWAEQHVG